MSNKVGAKKDQMRQLLEFIRKDERFTLIAAMNLDGFIHEACYQIDRQVETVDMDTFSFYLDNILLPVMRTFSTR